MKRGEARCCRLREGHLHFTPQKMLKARKCPQHYLKNSLSVTTHIVQLGHLLLQCCCPPRVREPRVRLLVEPLGGGGEIDEELSSPSPQINCDPINAPHSLGKERKIGRAVVIADVTPLDELPSCHPGHGCRL